MISDEILQQIKLLLNNRSVPFSLIKDKVNYRRAHIVRLSLQGCKQREIARELKCSISTVEKDFRSLRELGN